MGRPTMPPPPGPRLQPPVYEEPEPMGWKKALLGIGLSAGANLIGQGPQAADQFFCGPQRKAERDFAREMGEWKDSELDFKNWWDRLGQGERTDLQRQQLGESRRRNMDTAFYQRGMMNRGVNVDGSLIHPFTGEQLYKGTGFRGDTQGERDRQQAYEWYADQLNKPAEELTVTEEVEGWSLYRQHLGMEPLSPVLEDEGVFGRFRSDAAGQLRPQPVYGDPNALGGFSTTPPRAMVGSCV